MKPKYFSLPELVSKQAFDEWGLNCGPGALAAICEKTLDEVRYAIPKFERLRYTSPSMMYQALRNLRVDWEVSEEIEWPSYGLVRVQWEGPWSKPGVPIAARYRYTHWVGGQIGHNSIGVFDINCMNNGTGWCSLRDWSEVVAPYIAKQYPRANGKWHLTHSIEVRPAP